MKIKNFVLFSAFLLPFYPVAVHALNNCRPGSNCELPGAFPGVPPQTKATFTEKKQVFLGGAFNDSVTDPSNGDDSFIYYLELVGTETYVSWVDTGKVNENSQCTICDSVSRTLKYQSGWTNSATFGLNIGLTVGAPPATATLGSTFSTNYSLSQSVEESITKNFTLDCCSRTRFLYLLNHEDSIFKIGWQKDVFNGWEDQGFKIYRANKIDVGLDERTINGKCVPVPEPSTILSLLALGTLGAASTLKRKLKPSQSTEKETTKVG